MENKSRHHKPYTEEEEQLLRDGATSLPGRTQNAVFVHRYVMGLGKIRTWTSEEIELARNNQVPEGRTDGAMRTMRYKLGCRHHIVQDNDGQMRINFDTVTESHKLVHIHTIVGKFVNAVVSLTNSGMSIEQISNHTGKTVAQVQMALDLANSLRKGR